MNQAPILFDDNESDRPSVEQEAFSYAEVLVTLPFGEVFDYRYSCNLPLQLGSIVQIPFGKRTLYGVVSALKEKTNTPPEKIKDVISVVQWCALKEQDLAFLRWMSDYTMIPKGLVLKMFLSVPAAFEPEKPLYAYKVSQGFSGSLTDKQNLLMEWFQGKSKACSGAEIQKGAGVSAAIIKGALDKGALTLVPFSTVYQNPDADFLKLSYSPEQQAVVESLSRAVSSQSYEAILVDGVTGSGKTEVYFEAIAQALREGRQSVVLLPEISLTPQWLERFKKRFGAEPVGWHSQMTPVQRRKAWQRLAKGEASVIVGARSALMLPYPNLGLIIVDEEHETSYKQEESATYHARDMAVARAYHLGIPIVLVSATPSLESYVNAKEGKYSFLKIPHRHAGATMPSLEIVDMRSHDKKASRGNLQFMAAKVRSALVEAVSKGEQALLFLNRRGYAPLTLCRGCGERLECPHCTAWLVQHKSVERLQCHHCGFVAKRPKTCPKCEEEDSFIACGPGVERIAEEVKALLPEARLLIMASDAFETTTDLVKAIECIQKGEVDVIIGTQMMAKGHHFPKLTLVGVIDADLGLSGGDLRACEKTYQLLQQVSGRCGRAEKKGRVLLQTYYPEHPVLQALAADDKKAFIEQEMLMRQAAGMPPYTRLAALICSSQDQRLVEQWVKSLGRHAPRIEGVDVLGPVQPAMALLRRYHRWRFLIRAPKNYPLQKYIKSWLSTLELPRHIKLQIDIDPISFT
ncbi:MAG: primosomal protein N' [Alphaproteobacteria bacterium]|nr:primosomal protein N' [Alphaproteobacteria bacterium]NCQ66826.1 primosomal protein N' [Alphaproteobacteria bacterium]NCT07394.1 primosomal protein N' [Alphaproteobacteria bacterium]